MIKKVRYALEALVLLFFLSISKILPAHWASNLGGWIGRTIGPHLATSRKAINHIQFAMPDTTDERAREIMIGMWDNLGRVMMEYAHLEHIGRDRTKVIGKEIIEQYKDTPIVLVSGHLGNWEVCPPAFHMQMKANFVPIYRAPNNPFSDWMLQNARSLKRKIKTIPKSRTGTRHIVQAMNNGDYIGMLIDQKYNEGVAANFFGHPAMTSPIFAQLAQKFKCPLIPLRIERTRGCNFLITIEEPLVIKNKTPESIIAETHDLLEKWITERPEQWLWLHKRWGKINDKA